jgi:tRNA (guanine-N7-)-methyltransferase
VGKKKIQRFAEVAAFPNVFHMSYEDSLEGFKLKGKWNNEYFHNDHPIVLELGCGKGEYTVGLAQRYPQKNFIGVDIKGNRIWMGARHAVESKMDNVGFLRTRIDFIRSAFGKGEVSEIWITFPDPQPQKPRERKRLTSPQFLDKYKDILAPGGLIHLKTDNFPLYEYTLEVIKKNGYELLEHTDDLYGKRDIKGFGDDLGEVGAIKTYYEKKFSDMGFKINYIRFRM